MPPHVIVTPKLRQRIVQLKTLGMSLSAISREFGRSKSVIYRILKLYKEKKTFKSPAIVGRPRKIVTPEGGAKKRFTREDPFKTAAGIFQQSAMFQEDKPVVTPGTASIACESMELVIVKEETDQDDFDSNVKLEPTPLDNPKNENDYDCTVNLTTSTEDNPKNDDSNHDCTVKLEPTPLNTLENNKGNFDFTVKLEPTSFDLPKTAKALKESDAGPSRRWSGPDGKLLAPPPVPMTEAGSAATSCDVQSEETLLCLPGVNTNMSWRVSAENCGLQNSSPKDENCNKEKFTCHLCEHETHNKDNLKQHILKHYSYSIKPYPCFQCHYTANKIRSLKSHLITHKSNQLKSFACNHCLYRTNYKRSLRKHSFTHDSNRIKPYSCNHCNYNAYSRGSLKSHLYQHLGGAYCKRR